MPFSSFNLTWSVGRQKCTLWSWQVGGGGAELGVILFYLPMFTSGNAHEKYHLRVCPKNLIEDKKDKDEVFIGLYFVVQLVAPMGQNSF